MGPPPESISTDARLEKARICVSAGRLDEALDHYRAVLDAEPLQVEALTALTALASRLGKSAEVVPVAERLVGLQADHPELHRIAGTILLSSGQPDAAWEYLQKAIDLEPTDAGGVANGARALLKAGRRQEATVFARHSATMGVSDSDLASLITANARPQCSSATDNLKVVVISDHLTPREAKLGRAIRLAGGEAVLLTTQNPPNNSQNDFAQVVRYGTPWQALQIAKTLGCDIFHVCPHMNYDTAQIFVAHRPGAVVVDTYDVLNGMWTEEFFAKYPQFEAGRNAERFALEQADGLCVRSLQTQVLKHDFGYNLSQPAVFWPEYCLDEDAPARKLSADDGKLHVIFSGNVNDGDNPYYWLAEFLDELGIHFHFYPLGGPPDVPGFRQRFAKYIDLETKHPHFHVHTPVVANLWLETVSQYDILVSFSNVMFSGQDGEAWTVAKTHRTMTNKLFECLDANLLLLSHQNKFVTRIAERYGFGLGVTHAEATSSNWWEELRGRVLADSTDWAEARAVLSVQAQAPRLMQFYRAALRQIRGMP